MKSCLKRMCGGLIGWCLLAPLAMQAQSEKPGVQGTMLLQTGEASTFALPLADFGQGPGQQDMAVFQFSNLFKGSDGVTLYGWQTMDTKGIVDWDAAAIYKVPILNLAGGTVSVSTGVQRWHLPLVAGTDDWVSDNSLYYSRPGRIPLNIEADTKTVVSSNRDLAKGSFLVLTATTSVPIHKFGHYATALRHGPTFVEGLGMYGVNGARAFRYEGALLVSRGTYSLEFLGRPQIGLQPGLKDSIFWGASLTKSFHLFGPRE